MDNLSYASLGSRKNKIYKTNREIEMLTLKDFIESKWTIQNLEELKVTFVRDLKKLLLKENLFDLIQTFFDLETDLNLAQEKLLISEELNLNLDDFYKTLSPVLMRAILDNAKIGDENLGLEILNSVKESIRIAIEEVIYNVEDKYES